ncbi:biotin/lipoyl-containing protein [Tsukamurella sp. PLM1]|nr:biotin/lipoyl-containing protein [Tsukamurella sp. PLM1]
MVEAMKMEHRIIADASGTVRFTAEPGVQVTSGDPVVLIDPEEAQ